MTVNAATLRKLSALSLSAEQMVGVLDILATTEEADEARKAAQRERTRKAREKQRNVTVASQSDDGNRDDTRGGVARVEDKTSNLEISKEGKKEPARAARLPEDWTLPAEWKAEAVAMGLPPQRCDIEAATMRDWSRSHPNGAKRDWHAAWRNWVRRAVDNLNLAVPRNRGPTAPSLAQVFGMVREKAAENEQRRDGGGGAGAVVLNLPAVRAQ